MGQPFPGVWLPQQHQHPRRPDLRARLDGAPVPPRVLQLPQGRRHVEDPGAEVIAALLLAGDWRSSPDPKVRPSESVEQERIAEIRVHGNATLTDDAVIALAGIAPGATLDAGRHRGDREEAARQRPLRRSRRCASATARWRWTRSRWCCSCTRSRASRRPASRRACCGGCAAA